MFEEGDGLARLFEAGLITSEQFWDEIERRTEMAKKAAKKSVNASVNVMVFDWIKLATSILDNPDVAVFHIGIMGDWKATAVPVWYAGEPFTPDGAEYTLSSTWGEPGLYYIDASGGSVHVPCWFMSECEEDRKRVWPEAAMELLGL